MILCRSCKYRQHRYQLTPMESFSLHQQLEQHRVVLSYKGSVTPQLTSGALEAVEGYMTSCEEPPRVRRKVYNVLVECLHNLFHHPVPRKHASCGFPLPDRSSVFMVRATEAGYEVSGGNYVVKDKVQQLSQRIQEINGLSADRLRELYRSVLATDERSERGGGGLGFIDMVRKSGNPVRFEFHPVDEHHAFFTFTASVSRNEPAEQYA